MFVNANYSREPEAIAMSAIHGSSADRADRQGAYFEGSLELLRELAVTTARCALLALSPVARAVAGARAPQRQR